LLIQVVLPDTRFTHRVGLFAVISAGEMVARMNQPSQETAKNGAFGALSADERTAGRGLSSTAAINPAPASQPAAMSVHGDSEIEREIRFAVVIYGGVSLTIYINRIVQEMLHRTAIATSMVLDVKPGETSKPSLTLPIAAEGSWRARWAQISKSSSAEYFLASL
jgi:hypothetical protein